MYKHILDRPYFEGWYFKYQMKDEKTIAFIPAIHKNGCGQGSASLQIITENGAWWQEYPETEFHVIRHPLQITLGHNTFGEKGISLQIECRGLSLNGELQHGSLTPLSSDIMGPFRFVSQLECTHGVVSMAHHLDGILTLNGKMLDFTGGLGYIETDRGRSFPNRYLWTQCNWTVPKATSLMLAIANIPVLKYLHFTGIICSVCHGAREYRLATYKGARIRSWSEHGAEVVQGKYRLSIEVLEKQERPLRAPVEGAMGRIIHESLCAKVQYRFWEKRHLIFEHTDDRASFEYTEKSTATENDKNKRY